MTDESSSASGSLSLVRKTAAVLRGIASFPKGVGLSELARETGLKKATTYRVLTELEAERIVALDPETRRYVFGVGMFALAEAMTASDGLLAEVRSILAALAADAEETTGIDVLDGTRVLVAMQVQGPLLIGQAYRTAPRTIPITTTSTGKVLLAWSRDRGLVEAAVRGGTLRADGTAVTIEEFDEMLAQVRTRGYGTAVDELEIGASAVAVPVFIDEEVVASVWVGGPSFRLTKSKIRELATALKPVAAELGSVLALRGPGMLLDTTER
jgi:IclR family transcriptional regulator, acetate operon repressor